MHGHLNVKFMIKCEYIYECPLYVQVIFTFLINITTRILGPNGK